MNSSLVEPLRSVVYRDEPSVNIECIHLTSFTWPNGKELKSSSESTDIHSAKVLVFPKRVKDRTCLLTEDYLGFPKAKVYIGAVNLKPIVEYINIKCNVHRSLGGYLTVEGLHRESILENIFHVGRVSLETMGEIYRQHQQNNTSYQDCLADNSDEKSRYEYLMDKEHSYSCPIMPIVSVMDSKETTTTTITSSTGTKNWNNIAQNINQCERIPLPSKSDFFHNYLKISKPVIITGALDSWIAREKWTNLYLRKNYGKREVHIKLTPAGEFEGVEPASLYENYKSFRIPNNVKKQLLFPDLVVVRPATANMHFSKFMDIVETVANGDRTNISAYLEYSSIPEHLPELENDIAEMPFIKGILKREHLNIWLSDGNTLGKLHFDPYDNFLCQLSGVKQVTLFDPHRNEELYEAHIPEAMLSYNATTREFTRKTLIDSTSMVMSPVDILKPDFQRFPNFQHAKPMNCTINEGEVLFMPSFWWHEVQSYPNKTAQRNLAVNYWYDPFLTKEFPCMECRLDINPKYRHLL